MIFYLLPVDDAFNDSKPECRHHNNFYCSNPKKEPGLEGSKLFGYFQCFLGSNHVPVHHTQGGQTNTSCDEHADDTISSMPGHLAMSSKIGLNDQIDIPNCTCPVMYMHRPGVLRKISPIILVDPQLHNDHWDYHPYV